MLNDPEPQNKSRPHPLEQRPQPEPSPQGDGPSNQRFTLHIPVVGPYLTQALVAINSVIFFVAFYVISESQLRELYDWGANNHLAVLNFGEFHRLVSAMFLHGDPLHIVFNMYGLYMIGQTIERFFGHARFAIIYFLGGLSGSILSVVLNGPLDRSVGASGAVFALFGALMVFLYKHKKLFGEMGRQQLRQLVLIAGINLLYGFATTLNTSGVQIDNWGHIGGFAGGAVLAWFIGPIFIPKRHPTNPQGLAIDDINPLKRTYNYAIAYGSCLMIMLLAAMFLARNGGF